MEATTKQTTVTEQTAVTGWHSLPAEIKLAVIGKIREDERLVPLRLVSKQFKELVEVGPFWDRRAKLIPKEILSKQTKYERLAHYETLRRAYSNSWIEQPSKKNQQVLKEIHQHTCKGLTCRPLALPKGFVYSVAQRGRASVCMHPFKKRQGTIKGKIPEGHVTAMSLYSEEKLLCGTNQGVFYVWNFGEKKLKKIHQSEFKPISDLIVQPRGKCLVYCQGSEVIFSTWKDDVQSQIVDRKKEDFRSQITSIRKLNNKQLVITTESDVSLRSFIGGRVAEPAMAHGVVAAACPTGRHVVTVDGKSRVQCWKVKKKRKKKTTEFVERKSIQLPGSFVNGLVSFSTRENIIAIASSESFIYVLDMVKGTVLSRVNRQPDRVGVKALLQLGRVPLGVLVSRTSPQMTLIGGSENSATLAIYSPQNKSIVKVLQDPSEKKSKGKQSKKSSKKKSEGKQGKKSAEKKSQGKRRRGLFGGRKKRK